jgi:hypothetical protein
MKLYAKKLRKVNPVYISMGPTTQVAGSKNFEMLPGARQELRNLKARLQGTWKLTCRYRGVTCVYIQ